MPNVTATAKLLSTTSYSSKVNRRSKFVERGWQGRLESSFGPVCKRHSPYLSTLASVAAPISGTRSRAWQAAFPLLNGLVSLIVIREPSPGPLEGADLAFFKLSIG
jgi:hypothetical protein